MPNIKVENPFLPVKSNTDSPNHKTKERQNTSEQTREAPPKVAAKLKEFGVKWDGKLALKVIGDPAVVELADTTKRVTFNAGETFVEIVGYDENGSKSAILVSNGSVKLDGNELRFPLVTGDATLSEIQKNNENMVDQMQRETTVAMAKTDSFPKY